MLPRRPECSVATNSNSFVPGSSKSNSLAASDVLTASSGFTFSLITMVSSSIRVSSSRGRSIFLDLAGDGEARFLESLAGGSKGVGSTILLTEDLYEAVLLIALLV